MSLNFDALTATTYKNYKKTLADNIMKKISLLALLRKSGNIERRGGGIKIVEPLMYGLNNTFTTYRGYDVLPTVPQDGITAAEYDWKNAAVNIMISREEEEQNKGEARIINLLKAKIQQAEKTMELRLNEMMFGDGTGNNGKNFSGLAAYITPTPSTVGGINGVTYTWWRNQVETVPQAQLNTQFIPALRRLYNKCTREGDQPKAIITHVDLFEFYESQLQQIERITYSRGSELAGDLGFEVLLFKGKPIIWDFHCPANTLYVLNTDYLRLVIDPAQDFEMSEWRVPVNQMARLAFITLRGELVCSNRELQGLLRVTT